MAENRPNIGKATAELLCKHYDVSGWTLNADAVLADLRKEYSEKDILEMLGSFILEHPTDGRISPENRKWGRTTHDCKYDGATDPTRYGAHVGLVDILVTTYRKTQ